MYYVLCTMICISSTKGEGLFERRRMWEQRKEAAKPKPTVILIEPTMSMDRGDGGPDR